MLGGELRVHPLGSGPQLTPWITNGTLVLWNLPELVSGIWYPHGVLGLVPQAWTLTTELGFSFLLPLMFWIGRRNWPLLLIGSLCLLGLGREFDNLYYAIDFSLGVAGVAGMEGSRRVLLVWGPALTHCSDGTRGSDACGLQYRLAVVPNIPVAPVRSVSWQNFVQPLPASPRVYCDSGSSY
ncbi:MAG: hypothetical protein ACI8TX_003552 [Hyphomicrobiaceae bacterium]